MHVNILFLDKVNHKGCLRVLCRQILKLTKGRPYNFPVTFLEPLSKITGIVKNDSSDSHYSPVVLSCEAINVFFPRKEKRKQNLSTLERKEGAGLDQDSVKLLDTVIENM